MRGGRGRLRVGDARRAGGLRRCPPPAPSRERKGRAASEASCSRPLRCGRRGVGGGPPEHYLSATPVSDLRSERPYSRRGKRSHLLLLDTCVRFEVGKALFSSGEKVPFAPFGYTGVATSLVWRGAPTHTSSSRIVVLLSGAVRWFAVRGGGSPVRCGRSLGRLRFGDERDVREDF